MPLTTPSDEQPESHPLLGATLRGTYRILQVLDQGGMGTVFEAEHVRLRRRLAVKVLAQHLQRDQHALARFNREAEIISQLQHPHVVHVTDFDTTEQGEPYLVMELLQGESLAARLSRAGSLPVAEAVRITYQAASALAAAHEAAVVHRDLKPANVFLCNMGQGSLVKLLDFGISKRTGAGRGLTGEYDILGTPDYMAPEQALGKTAQVDHRGDQYALAVITYEMMAGQPPFSGTDVVDVLQQVISKHPPPLESVAPHVPERVSAVLARALSKEPSERFDSVLEFASSLLSAAGFSMPPAIEAIPASAPPASRQVTRAPSSPAEGVRTIVDTPSFARSTGEDATAVTLSRTPAEVSVAPAGALADATAVTLATSLTLKDLSHALAQARQAHDLGDKDLAVNAAETAVQTAEALGSPEAAQELEEAASLLDSIFEARLGSVKSRLVVLPQDGARKRVSPEQAFLLSRVDGGVTLDEALDLSPLSRRRTLRLLVGMLRQGLLATE